MGFKICTHTHLMILSVKEKDGSVKPDGRCIGVCSFAFQIADFGRGILNWSGSSKGKRGPSRCNPEGCRTLGAGGLAMRYYG